MLCLLILLSCFVASTPLYTPSRRAAASAAGAPEPTADNTRRTVEPTSRGPVDSHATHSAATPATASSRPARSAVAQAWATHIVISVSSVNCPARYPTVAPPTGANR